MGTRVVKSLLKRYYDAIDYGCRREKRKRPCEAKVFGSGRPADLAPGRRARGRRRAK